MKHWLVLVLVLMASISLTADVISFQGFDSAAADTWGYTPDPANFNTGSDKWDVVTSNSSINPLAGTAFWGVQDLQCPSSGDDPRGDIVFDDIDISSYTGCAFDFYYNLIAFDSTDYIGFSIQYSIDGVDYDSDSDNIIDYVVAGNVSGTNTGGWVNYSHVIPEGKIYARLTITFYQNGGSDYAGLDSVQLTGNPAGADPTITLLAPVGGEDWQRDLDHDILWNAVNHSNDLDIILRNGAGDTYLATGEANDGSFTWHIAADQQLGNDYQIIVRDWDFGVPADTSEVFTISELIVEINITNPVGGEMWRQGEDQDITWTNTHFAGNVDIIVADVITRTSTVIASNIANTGSYTWSIPADQAVGDYVVTVKANGAATPTDTSANFQVVAPVAILDIVINEINADPDGTNGDANGDGTVSSSNDEFIEFVNMESVDIDISGYEVHDGYGERYTFADGTIIEAGQAFVVFGGPSVTGDFGGAAIFTDLDSYHLGLNNSGDDVTLFNTFGDVVCTYTYGAEGGNNTSLTRNPDLTGDFVESFALNGNYFTPGKKNDGTNFNGSTNSNTTTDNIGAGGGSFFMGFGSVTSLEIANAGGDMGTVTVTTFTGQTAPFTIIGVDMWWDIDVETDQSCDLVFYYDDEYLNGIDESLLQIWHYTGGMWVALGGVVDTNNNMITLSNYSGGFSPFTLSGEQTLPVELSSFSATYTTEKFVQLNWTSQSETDMLGYNLLRGDNDTVTEALNLNLMIPATNTTSVSDYSYDDIDVDQGATYYYWLQSTDLDGSSSLYGPVSVTLTDGDGGGDTPEVPEATLLRPNYPNPFNPSTTISFDLANETIVNLTIFNARGQKVTTLIDNAVMSAGEYKMEWNAKNTGSGVYFVRLNTTSHNFMQKVLLVK